MKILPFRFREISKKTLITNEIGDYKIFDKGVVTNFFSNLITENDKQKLQELNVIYDENQIWKIASISNQIKKKLEKNNSLNYIIAIPTLRCNFSCSYCQVSRASVNSKGYDWDKETLKRFKNFIKDLNTNYVKIEFQGGEPTIRLDIIEDVIKYCKKLDKEFEFIICTNLSNLNEKFQEILEYPQVKISTSLDGNELVTSANRTNDNEQTKIFFKNLDYILKKFGPSKISALPTITEDLYDKPKELINTYRKYGFKSIFLRPVNYQGFARKKFEEISKDYIKWSNFYIKAIDLIREINTKEYFEEYYLSLLLERIFSSNIKNNYVDFRSPNFIAHDYLVIDYSGKFYPSDEARMLSRSKHIDLSIGSLKKGLNSTKINNVNFRAMNQVEPDCVHCSYMPYCGIDLVDDLSRYNRVDVSKSKTWFCNRNIDVFDFIFSKIINKEKEWLNLFLNLIYKSNNHNKTYETFYDRTEI